jgi:drug/metabolite transporter (DMT)-like permease
MLGIIFASAGYLASAGAQVIDKALLAKTFRHPVSFVFWIGVLSLGVFLVWPFDPEIPTLFEWPIVILAGLSFQLALLAYFNVVSGEEVSKAATVVGAIVPIITLLLSRWFLGERLTLNQSIGFILLLGGSVVVSYTGSVSLKSIKLFTLSIVAGILFAVSTVSMKAVFTSLAFIPGLVWTRLGAIILTCLLLVPSKYRQYIFARSEQPRGGKVWLFILNQFLGAIGFLLINLAVFVSSPTLVNALVGVQYAALFLLALTFSHWWPKIFREPITKIVIVRKLIGLVLIGLGLVYIAV